MVDEEQQARQLAAVLHKNWYYVDVIACSQLREKLSKRDLIRIMRRALDMMDGST